MKNRYTCEDVAKQYGVKVGTVWGWVRNKTLPATKVGKQYFIYPNDIKTMEDAGRTVQSIKNV